MVQSEFFSGIKNIVSAHDARSHPLVRASARGSLNTIKTEIPEIEPVTDPVLRLERTANAIIYQAFDSASVLGVSDPPGFAQWLRDESASHFEDTRGEGTRDVVALRVIAETTLNAEMGGTPSVLDFKSRVLLADELKRLIATESHALHPKYCDALTLFPWWRVSLSINNNVDRLKALPALTSDFGDKILLLLCESDPMPMPTGTPEERRAFRDVITAELPAFVAFLHSWEIPAELRTTRHASRFGHDHFHHPKLVAALFEQEAESSLLYILDNSPNLYNMTPAVFKAAGGKDSGEDDAWGWGPSEFLREQLCDETQFGRFAAQARKLLPTNWSACGSYLSKLAEKYPERFASDHTNKHNVWLIRAPKS